MLIYKNTFDNVKTIGFKFPIEDQFYASETEAIVADGITEILLELQIYRLVLLKNF